MDPTTVLHDGLGFPLHGGRPSLQQTMFYRRPPPYQVSYREPDSEQSQRTTHTLTACCRCRLRKTRCDATLPRCVPCDRAGSSCEYFDTTRNVKMSRSYVVDLQNKVRRAEAELAQYTEDDVPRDTENRMRHNGLVRPNGQERNETPRYLGASSGIAMTQLLLDKAKRYTESKHLEELQGVLRERRRTRAERMQSVVMGSSISGPSGIRQSWANRSIYVAEKLPERGVMDGLIKVFQERVQIFAPILHEKVLAEDVNAVYNGDKDPYKLFVVNMVVAISQKKVNKWNGLPDGYYLAAMQYFDEIVCPKDLKTLQCLLLISQYSLLTPVDTAVYYVIGLAIRICQKMRLGDEKTISLGVSDLRTLDMRRRLFWIVMANELGLAQMMGRPNGFARSADMVNVQFFDTVEDEALTPEATAESVRAGRQSERKRVAVHFCKMRLLQGELNQTLYLKKRAEPADENDPWFSQMAQKLKDWYDTCPSSDDWCKEWFKGRYYTMLILLYRPSSQIPKPSPAAALRCFEAAEQVIKICNHQIARGWVELTWVFLLTIYTSLNALLWSVSFPEVRDHYSKDTVEKLISCAQDAIDTCSERWPGAKGAFELYIILGKACLDGYNVNEGLASPIPGGAFDNTLPGAGQESPTSEDSSQQNQQPQSATSLFSNQSPFGYMFDPFTFNQGSHFQSQPSFRSNSIFMAPTTDANGRRLSNLAPDSNHTHESAASEGKGPTPPPLSTPTSQQQDLTPPTATINTTSLPTPPESLAPPPAKPSNMNLSPRLVPTTQVASPSPTPTLQHPIPMSGMSREPLDYSFSNLNPTPPPSSMNQKPPTSSSTFPNFTIPPTRGFNTQRGPTRAAWNAPPPPLIQPNAFAANMNSFWENSSFSDELLLGGGGGAYGFGDATRTGNALGLTSHGGMAGLSDMNFPWDGFGGQSFPMGRHGSLTQEQQVQLMGIVDTEGLNDISAYLQVGAGNNGSNGDGADMSWAH